MENIYNCFGISSSKLYIDYNYRYNSLSVKFNKKIIKIKNILVIDFGYYLC